MHNKTKLLNRISIQSWAFCVTVSWGLVLGGQGIGSAQAGEADDLQLMIDRARNGVADLERLDRHGVTRDEATVLRVWLDEAWRLRSEQRYDGVRVVLDRCDAQADMIRQKIETSNAVAVAKKKETALTNLRQEIEKTRTAIQEAQRRKMALEARGR